jgi:transposase, IS30 family
LLNNLSIYNLEMSQLRFEDCVLIEYLNKQLKSTREIGLEIWKSHVCISKELKKYSIDWFYDANTARETRKNKRIVANKSKCKYLTKSAIWSEIRSKILSDNSPEQAHWEMTNVDKTETFSTSTIYRIIYEYEPDLIKKHLRRWWKKYKKNGSKKYQIDWRVMIDERPKEIEARKTCSHREWDSIVWKWHKNWALTNVERASWFLICRKLKNICSREVVEQTILWFENIPKEMLWSITYDNGREFTDHTMIKFYTWMMVYFAHPYSPRERGTNENTNWLLRQYFPKGTDFGNITQEEIDRRCDLLNNRPRKRLWRLSPRKYLFVNFWLII